MYRARVLCMIAVLGILIAPTSVSAWNDVVVESKTLEASQTGAEVAILIENDVELQAIDMPLIVRSISGGAFWSANVDSLPASGRLQNALTEFRAFDTSIDYASPDQCRLGFLRIISSPVLPPGFLEPLTGLRFDVGPNVGEFEIDTAFYPPAALFAFLDFPAGQIIVPHFEKGVITVDPPNNCPVITGFGSDPLAAFVGLEATNSTSAFDPDGDPISYYLVSGPGTVNVNTGDWVYAPTCMDNPGGFDVEIEATDRGPGQCPTAGFHVDLISFPLDLFCTNLSVPCGEPAQQTVTTTGGCPPFTYTVVSGPGTISGDGTWEHFTDCGEVGVQTVEMEVVDMWAQADICAFDLTVTDNAPPILDPIGDQQVYEGELLTLDVTGYDPDGDPLRFYTGPLPPNAAFISATQEFFWTPDFNQEGQHAVTFYLSDGELEDTLQFQITVLDSRFGPAVPPMGRYYVREGDSVRIPLAGLVTGSTWDEEDDVHFPPDALTMPLGMTYDTGDSSLVWNPSLTSTGEYPGFSITFSDDDGGTAQTSGTFEVLTRLPIGDLNADDVINVLDVISSIDCVFRSTCTRALADYDVNCDQVPNVLDVVAMIDYVFRSGPPLYECPRVMIGNPGGDGSSVGPLEIVTALDISSAPISRMLFEYSTDQSNWFPIDSTDQHPSKGDASTGIPLLKRFWRTEDIPAGTAWLRAISEDSTHSTADTAVVEVTVNSAPIAAFTTFYDAGTGVAAFDARVSEDLENGIREFSCWRFTNDTMDVTRYGPVAQLITSPEDSFGVSLQVCDLDGAYAQVAYCAVVGGDGDSIKVNPQDDCKCTGIEVFKDGRVFTRNRAIWDRLMRTFLRESWDWLTRRYSRHPLDGLLELGPLVNLTDVNNGKGVIRFRFMVHIEFIGDTKNCEWGQKVQGSDKRKGKVEPWTSGGRSCAYGNATDTYCLDNYKKTDVAIHYMDVTKTDVWWSDSPSNFSLSVADFTTGATEADKGVYSKNKFKVWAKPDQGATPDCCTYCFELKWNYDKNRNPDPNPGGEPAISGEATPCPAPHNDCDPNDGN